MPAPLRKPVKKPVGTCEIPGNWVMRDRYRWFLCTLYHGVRWFYESDVVAIRLTPELPWLGVVDDHLRLPVYQTVVMTVALDARDHPAGKDW